MQQRYFPLADIAEYLGTTERHVRELVYRRAIPFSKLGGRLTFDIQAIDRWVASNAREVTG